MSFSVGCFIASAFLVKGHTAQKFKTAVAGTKAKLSSGTLVAAVIRNATFAEGAWFEDTQRCSKKHPTAACTALCKRNTP